MFYLLEEAVPQVAEKLANPAAGAKAVAETIKTTPTDQLVSGLIDSAIKFGLKVLAALAIFLIGMWVIRLVKKGLNKGFTRRKTDKTIVTFVNSLVTIGMWVILIIIAFGTLGVNTTSLAALLAAGGMAIGMALGGTVQNFAGGLMILVFKPFKVGDFIEAQGFMGTVSEVNMVSTKLITIDNREIIIPNGALSNGNINNISALPLRRVDQTVNVAYGIPSEKVKEAILEIIKANPKFLDATTKGAADPFVSVMGLKESTVEYVIRAWVNPADYWDCWFYLNEHLHDDLPAKGVKFSYRHVEVNLNK